MRKNTEIAEIVWRRIVKHQGQVFRQIRGGEFTYSIQGDQIVLSRTNWSIPRTHIEKALDLAPLESTVPVQHLFGPSYIYALIMDPRIRQSDW